MPLFCGTLSGLSVLPVNGKSHPFLLFCTSFILNEVHASSGTTRYLPLFCGSYSIVAAHPSNGKFHPFLLFCTSFMLSEVHLLSGKNLRLQLPAFVFSP